MRRITLWLVLTVVATPLVAAGQDWLPLRSAIVRVRGEENADGRGVNCGSGTLIAIDENGDGGGYVLTAKHVARGSRTMTAIWESGFSSYGPIVGQGKIYDTCVFRVAVPPGAVAIPVAEESPQPGESVDIVGYAWSRDFRTSRATVRTYTDSYPDQLMEINGQVIDGMSGGPIIYQGHVVGTIVGYNGRTYATHHQPIRNLLREILPHGLVAGIDARRQLAQCAGGACPPGYG